MERTIRNFAGFITWIVIAILALGLNAIVILSNYMGCKTSFELLGFEMVPLYLDKLLGPMFQVVLGECTMAHLYAMSMAITIGVAFFWLFRLGMDTYKLYDDRRGYIKSGDEESANIAIRRIIRNLIFIFVIAVPLIYAIKTDIGLLRYRWVAGALGIEEPIKATISISNWEHQVKENIGLFAWWLAGCAAWGYIGVTALACFAFELCCLKVSEYWARLVDALGMLIQPNPTGPNDDGPNGPGSKRARQDPDASMDTGKDSNSTNRQQKAAKRKKTKRGKETETDVHETETQETTGEKPLFNSDQSCENGSGQSNSSDTTPTPQGKEENKASDASHGDGQQSKATQKEDLRDVIGSPKGERVTLEDAQKDPQRYKVNMETGEIWDTDYWKSINVDK